MHLYTTTFLIKLEQRIALYQCAIFNNIYAMGFELKLESLKYLQRTRIVMNIAVKVLNLGLFFQKNKLIYKLFVSSSSFYFSFLFSFIWGRGWYMWGTIYHDDISGLPIYLLI